MSQTLSSPLGATLVDLLLVMAVTTVLAGISIPAVTQAVDAGRARHAAGLVAARFRLARAHAASATTAVAVVFDRAGDRWTFRVCEDRNGNGVRRAELDRGPDRCVEGPYDLAALFAGVRVAADGAVRGPDGEAGSADPVRFGVSDMASFAPAGTSTAGSLWLRSAAGTQYLVRIAGITGRVRILRYDTGAGQWRDG